MRALTFATVVAAFSSSTLAAYSKITSEFNSSNSLRKKEFPENTFCEGGGKSYAGWADIGSRHLFYWFQTARNPQPYTPVMLWLTGGPGGSGIVAALVENGDCLLTSANSTAYNDLSWTNLFHIIYIDQPVGVGLSYTDDPSNNGTYAHYTEDAALDIIAFLRLFQLGFPEYSQNELHIVGESYGGRYVPMYGDYVIRYNQLVGEKDRIPLASLVAISPWTNPAIQVSSIFDVACYPYRQYPSVLNASVCSSMAEKLQDCEALASSCGKTHSPFGCFKAGEFCESAIMDKVQHEHTNKYDRGMYCEIPGRCYPMVFNSQKFVNRPEIFEGLFEVTDATGGRKKEFHFEDPTVAELFHESGDIWMDTTPHVKSVLDYSSSDAIRNSGLAIPMMFAPGDADLLVTAKGTLKAVENVRWKNYPIFRNTLFENLSSKSRAGGGAGGYAKKVDGLWFVEIAEAGHMSPSDQPEVWHNLLEEWLSYVAEYRTGANSKYMPHSNSQTVLASNSEL